MCYRCTQRRRWRHHPPLDDDYQQEGPEIQSGTRTAKEYIIWVQKSLNKVFRQATPLKVSGSMDDRTKRWIVIFQKKVKLDPTGSIDDTTETALAKTAGTPPPNIHAQVVPQSVTCVGEIDITREFRNFITDAQVKITKISTIPKDQIPTINSMIQAIVAPENNIDIMKLTVFTCSRINSPLLLFGEKAGAAIYTGASRLSLSDATWDWALQFLQTGDMSLLTAFLTTIAHEKRHATLGTTVTVRLDAVTPGHNDSDAEQARYRVEEILVRAEEVAVSKRMSAGYRVPVNFTQLIRHHWELVGSIVNYKELARLRDLVIAELRKRYGFKSSCDNTITVGILSAMETARWYGPCSNGAITGTIPAGLNICKTKDKKDLLCTFL